MLKRVFVAMSGGIDSSVSAYLLKEAGYDVSGIHLNLTPDLAVSPEASGSDLERTCRLLGIPLHYLDAQKEFKSRVIEYFCEEYGRGCTPNPCIKCNQVIKFGFLLDQVMEMGADFLATGHYARIESSQTGFSLLKGRDLHKDQSYFLYVLGQRELAHVLFPIGAMLKDEVKQLAVSLGLPAAGKQESQDICFIPDNDSHAFLSSRLSMKPGEIVDMEGRVLGRHQGLFHYTIGQRQGVRVSAAERLYVIGLDIGSNRLVIGHWSQLFKEKLTAYNLNWVSGYPPECSVEVMAKVRYRSPEAKAVLQVINDKADVRFAEPQRAIALGQSVVFYQGEKVLGGGIICETG